VLGVANRMAPQLDVFFISLSLKSSIGAFMVALSLYSLLALAPDLFRDQHRWMDRTVRELHPAAGTPPAPPRPPTPAAPPAPGSPAP
jgi:hypothetical protein